MNEMDALKTKKEISDEELASEAKAGSRCSFEQLVHRYSIRLYYYLRPKVSTDEDAEEIVQETFLKAFRNINRFDSTYKFSTWIYTIATRLAFSWLRKKQLSENLLLLSVPFAKDPQDFLIQEENKKNLWQTARSLPVKQYQTLWLYYVEDLSLKEIANVMKKSQVHVRVLLHRARLSLFKKLNSLRPIEETMKPVAVGKITFLDKEI